MFAPYAARNPFSRGAFCLMNDQPSLRFWRLSTTINATTAHAITAMPATMKIVVPMPPVAGRPEIRLSTTV